LYTVRDEFIGYPSSEEELQRIMDRYDQKYLPGWVRSDVRVGRGGLLPGDVFGCEEMTENLMKKEKIMHWQYSAEHVHYCTKRNKSNTMKSSNN
jgi:hypothetical protein